MDGANRSVRLTPEEWAAVERFRARRGLRSLSGAVRELDRRGQRLAPWARSLEDRLRAALSRLRMTEDAS